MNYDQARATLVTRALADLITRWGVEAVVLALGAALRERGLRSVTVWKKEETEVAA